ncbi:MAG: aromatic-ring-hydroxylating dioxygenase subunit beta [Rhodanobacteraceae bacterium]
MSAAARHLAATSAQYWAIARHQGAYVRCIDDEGARAWPSFFTEQCLYVVTNDDNYRAGLPAGIIYADNRAMLQDRIASLYKANVYEQHTYRHLLGQPDIRDVSDGTIDSETNFLVARTMRSGETSLFAAGRYVDRYRLRADGGVLLEKRIVVCDSRAISTLLAFPL